MREKNESLARFSSPPRYSRVDDFAPRPSHYSHTAPTRTRRRAAFFFSRNFLARKSHLEKKFRARETRRNVDPRLADREIEASFLRDTRMPGNRTEQNRTERNGARTHARKHARTLGMHARTHARMRAADHHWPTERHTCVWQETPVADARL